MERKIARKQCAVIAYRRRESRARMLLVTSLDTQRWVLPKGHVEPHLSVRESAELEAYEEAGVEGVIARRAVGTYLYQKSELADDGLCEVSVFPMEVRLIRRDWPERSLRIRRWMKFKDAAAAVDERELQQLLLRFAKTIGAV